VTRAAAALAALVALGCAAPVRTDFVTPDPPTGFHTLALVPLGTDPLGLNVPEAAPRLVTARVASALESETKLRVVDPSQAQAVLTGVVRRYVERDGTSTGVRHPASVWIILELRDPEGRELWTGSYEETQPALSEDAGSLPRAWERGFRWVTADDLAAYGARELVRELAREVATWS
jgi:hypothetical protein